MTGSTRSLHYDGRPRRTPLFPPWREMTASSWRPVKGRRRVYPCKGGGGLRPPKPKKKGTSFVVPFFLPCVDKKDAGAAEGQTDLLAVAVIQRPFWAAPRVRRKFGAKRRISGGRALPARGLKSPKGGAARGRGAQNKKPICKSRWVFYSGASDEARTRYLHLGKVALYQMSYTRGDKRYYTKIRRKVNP